MYILTTITSSEKLIKNITDDDTINLAAGLSLTAFNNVTD